MRYDNFIPQSRFVRIRSRGRLPHWEVDNAIYFIPFSLPDAVPVRVMKELFEERERLMRRVKAPHDRARLDRALELRLDQQLDRGQGSCILREHGDLVADALKFFDRERYELHAWCVMPNHVHVVVYLEHGADLENVLHSWKSYTAHEIGRGHIWMKEYFDRVIRSPRDYADTCTYVKANPAKAGLSQWPWVG